jgi:hypothetical protein
MKRFLGSGLAIGVLALTAQSASAQSMVFLSAGVTFPSGEFADVAEDGWMAQGGMVFPVGAAGFSLGVGGFYGVNNHDVGGDATNLFGGGAFILYDIAASGSLQPYLFAGPSYMVHAFKSDAFADASSSGLAAQVGAGVNVPAGGLTSFLEAMFTKALSDDINGTDFIAISVGIDIPLG